MPAVGSRGLEGEQAQLFVESEAWTVTAGCKPVAPGERYHGLANGKGAHSYGVVPSGVASFRVAAEGDPMDAAPATSRLSVAGLFGRRRMGKATGPAQFAPGL